MATKKRSREVVQVELLPEPKKKKNPHAAALAALGASKGGKARAERLTPVERSEIAKHAASARWSKTGETQPPQALCGSPDHPLRIGEVEIPCYVLEDGTRLLAQRGLQTGIGMSTSGGSGGAHRLARFVASLATKNLETKDLALRIENPILFIPPGTGVIAYGYEATILPEMCNLVLEARRSDKLLPQQQHIATQCEILLQGLSTVGIIALVDEATGYQDIRARDALAQILEKFIAKELRPWVRTFLPDFYKEMFRLRGWEYSEKTTARPGVVGTLTDNIVYKRLAPGVRDELRKVTPKNAKGRFKHPLHRRLTQDMGHPKLREHLASVTSLMKISSNWDQFMIFLDQVHPEYGKTLILPGMPVPAGKAKKGKVEAKPS